MKANTPEFEKFLADFENLNTNISKNKPYASFFVGDFNAHSLSWWPSGDTNAEGFALDNLLSTLDLRQLINEPTNFEENKSPSCIDLVICDQPNVVIESGVRPSPDNFCRHQMIFCNLNLHIPPPPMYSRKIWHYNRANSDAMNKAVTVFLGYTTWKISIPLSKLNFLTTKSLISQLILYPTTLSKSNLRTLPGLPTIYEGW